MKYIIISIILLIYILYSTNKNYKKETFTSNTINKVYSNQASGDNWITDGNYKICPIGYCFQKLDNNKYLCKYDCNDGKDESQLDKSYETPKPLTEKEIRNKNLKESKNIEDKWIKTFNKKQEDINTDIISNNKKQIDADWKNDNYNIKWTRCVSDNTDGIHACYKEHPRYIYNPLLPENYKDLKTKEEKDKVLLEKGTDIKTDKCKKNFRQYKCYKKKIDNDDYKVDNNERYYNLKKWDLVSLALKLWKFSEYPEIGEDQYKLSKVAHKEKAKINDVIHSTKLLKEHVNNYLNKFLSKQNYKKIEEAFRLIEDANSADEIVQHYETYREIIPIYTYKNNKDKLVYRLSSPPKLLVKDEDSCFHQQYKFKSWNEEGLCNKLWELSKDEDEDNKPFLLVDCKENLEKIQNDIRNFKITKKMIKPCLFKNRGETCNFDNKEGKCELMGNDKFCQENGIINYLTFQKAAQCAELSTDDSHIIDCDNKFKDIYPIKRWTINSKEQYRLKSNDEDKQNNILPFKLDNSNKNSLKILKNIENKFENKFSNSN